MYFAIKLMYKVSKYFHRSSNRNHVHFNAFLSCFLLKLYCFLCLFFSLFLHFGTLLSIWETNWKVLPLAKLEKLCLLQDF